MADLKSDQNKSREEIATDAPTSVKSAERTQMESGAKPIESTSLVDREKSDLSEWERLDTVAGKDEVAETSISGIHSYMKSTGRDPFVRPKGQSDWKRATMVLKDQVFERAWDPEFATPGSKTGTGTDVVQSPTPKVAAENMAKADVGKKDGGADSAVDADLAPDGTNPVEKMSAHDAADAVSRMRSKDKLKSVVDSDQRASVKAAAQKRLDEMG